MPTEAMDIPSKPLPINTEPTLAGTAGGISARLSTLRERLANYLEMPCEDNSAPVGLAESLALSTQHLAHIEQMVEDLTNRVGPL